MRNEEGSGFPVGLPGWAFFFLPPTKEIQEHWKECSAGESSVWDPLRQNLQSLVGLALKRYQSVLGGCEIVWHPNKG